VQGDEQVSGLAFDQALFDQLATAFGDLHLGGKVFGPHLSVADGRIFLAELANLGPGFEESLGLAFFTPRVGWPCI